MEENTDKFIQDFEIKIKKKNHSAFIGFIIRISTVAVVFLMLIVYFSTDLSKITNYSLDGNVFLDRNDVCDIINQKENASLFKIDTAKSEELLSNHPLIASAKVSVTPFNMTVKIDEKAFACRTGDNYLNSHGELISKSEIEENAIVSSYIESKEIKLDKLPIYKPSEIHNKEENKFLAISSRIFKEKNLLSCISPCDEYNYYFYIYDGNADYYRLRFKYNSDLSLNEYVKWFTKSEEFDKILSSIVTNSNYSLVNDKIENENIKCYGVGLTFSKSNGSVKVVCEGSV